jgi:hypothetical protein
MSDQVRRIVTQPAPVGDEVISLYQSTPATRVAAFAYKQPVATTAPKPEQEGYEWGAIDVRTCALVDEIVVSTRPWMVAYADSTMARVIHRLSAIPRTVVSLGRAARAERPVCAGLDYRARAGW